MHCGRVAMDAHRSAGSRGRGEQALGLQAVRFILILKLA